MRWLAVLWIVSWTAAYMEQVECGKDAYTRQKKVCDLRIERIFRERFETQEEAKRFIDGCPEGVCKDWEIDEVHE